MVREWLNSSALFIFPSCGCVFFSSAVFVFGFGGLLVSFG
jgi:hypothetical protein